jgi:hydrogenase maturation factor
MRNVETYAVNRDEDYLKVQALDEPGAGGANHLYSVTGFNTDTNASYEPIVPEASVQILFQNGPIGEVGINGVTQEVLLAIVLDRLKSFQAGQYSCRENALAMTKIEEGLHWLQQRTLARMRRGVEGTHQK